MTLRSKLCLAFDGLQPNAIDLNSVLDEKLFKKRYIGNLKLLRRWIARVKIGRAVVDFPEGLRLGDRFFHPIEITAVISLDMKKTAWF